MNNKKFYITENKYLADALSFLGYQYYKFTDYNNKLVYSFKRTERLIEQIERKENYNK